MSPKRAPDPPLIAALATLTAALKLFSSAKDLEKYPITERVIDWGSLLVALSTAGLAALQVGREARIEAASSEIDAATNEEQVAFITQRASDEGAMYGLATFLGALLVLLFVVVVSMLIDRKRVRANADSTEPPAVTNRAAEECLCLCCRNNESSEKANASRPAEGAEEGAATA